MLSKRRPTLDDQMRVRELAAIGLAHDDIAAQLGLSSPKLQKRFKRELRAGAADGRRQALTQLHTLALSGENLSALTFWVKARCGWRDTGPASSDSQVIRSCMLFKPESEKPQQPEPSPQPENPHADHPL